MFMYKNRTSGVVCLIYVFNDVLPTQLLPNRFRHCNGRTYETNFIHYRDVILKMVDIQRS